MTPNERTFRSNSQVKSRRWGSGWKGGFCFNCNEQEGSLPQQDKQHQQGRQFDWHQYQGHGIPQGGKARAGNGNTMPNSPSKPAKLPEQIGVTSPSRFWHSPKDVSELRHNPGCNVDIFSFEEMKIATKHFRPNLVLGEGGFGVVYRGTLDDTVRPGYRTTEVAIKQLNLNGLQGDKEWLAEVNHLGQLSHPNLVKLIGYCCEDDQRLLVYEYVTSGCLEKHLFRRTSSTLTWLRRINIALDVAKGLAFLHGLEHSIIYRDFKTSNILLDANFNAKLSDFGLAKAGPIGDQTHVTTQVLGTYGYAAPEYIMTGHLTARSDVYGFGVVLLEMLIGKKAVDRTRPSPEYNLVEWARPILNNNKKLHRILDARIDGQYSKEAMVRVANMAHRCLSSNPRGRPVMSEVVEILEKVYSHELRRSEGNGSSSTLTFYKTSQAGIGISTRSTDRDDRGKDHGRRLENRKLQEVGRRSKSDIF